MKTKVLVWWVFIAFITGASYCLGETKGKIRVSADKKGAYIYVNGQKKAMTGEGYTSILLPEGEYEIKVEKESEDGLWIFRGVKTVFVGADTSTKIEITTEKIPSAKRQDAIKSILADMESDFVKIQPGTFMMGSPEDEPERYSDEIMHKVILTKGFYMQATEVTQAQWEAVMGDNPSNFKDCGPNCPVETVSWDDVQEFIKKLNQITGKSYRLPFEAEWEYACRAGTTTPFAFGRCLSTDQANYNGDYPLKGCPKGLDRQKPTPVRTFHPNAWGLYDMHGNVWEWCQDYEGDYPDGSVTDPKGPSTGEFRVLRGGSWIYYGRSVRSAVRHGRGPGDRFDDSGFRLARGQ